MMGSLDGAARAVESSAYTDRLLRSAHKEAINAFDVAAAATARAGYFPHMYEFGTAGITPGEEKYVDPTSPLARLWIHRMEGRGRQQDITFTYRPAKERNPVPTTETTGVPAKYLAKLSRRKYVFWNKAMVMETGMQVQNKSQQDHGFLFLPFKSNPGLDTAQSTGRGFVLWNTNTKGLPPMTVPGRNTRGKFTAFWNSWWSSQGEEVFNRAAETKINSDMAISSKRATARALRHIVKPVFTSSSNATFRSASSLSRKEFGRNGN